MKTKTLVLEVALFGALLGSQAASQVLSTLPDTSYQFSVGQPSLAGSRPSGFGTVSAENLFVFGNPEFKINLGIDGRGGSLVAILFNYSMDAPVPLDPIPGLPFCNGEVPLLPPLAGGFDVIFAGVFPDNGFAAPVTIPLPPGIPVGNPGIIVTTIGVEPSGCLFTTNGFRMSSQEPVGPPPAIVTGPALSPNRNRTVPNSTTVRVQTNIPTQVELSFFDGPQHWSVLADEEFKTEHNLPVLGMRQDRPLDVRVTVRDRLGGVSVAPTSLSFTPPPLPADFPPLQTTMSNPVAMEHGFTLFSVRSANPLGTDLVMVDEEGGVVWYYDGSQSPLTAGQSAVVFPLPSGDLLVSSGNRLLFEMNFAGDVKQIWWASGLGTAGAPAGATMVPIDSFHHDVVVLPPGGDADFLTLSTELRVLPDYPSTELDLSVTNPTANVVGDTIVEFKRDGTVVRELSLFDILDPYRLSYDSLGNFWNDLYSLPDTEDWSHANAVVLDSSDNSYVVSVRHQDVVAKIGRDTGNLLWLLGDEDRWRSPWAEKLLVPSNPAYELSYHTHAPEITRAGTLLLFDNGNNRAIPPLLPMPVGASYSRAVEYRINPITMTFEQVWSYGGMFDVGHAFYGFFVGDANQLPNTGNVLVTVGGRPGPPTHARIVEVTRSTPPVELFDIVVRDEDPIAPVSYSVYRAFRMSSFYR